MEDSLDVISLIYIKKKKTCCKVLRLKINRCNQTFNKENQNTEMRLLVDMSSEKNRRMKIHNL